MMLLASKREAGATNSQRLGKFYSWLFSSDLFQLHEFYLDFRSKWRMTTTHHIFQIHNSFILILLTHFLIRLRFLQQVVNFNILFLFEQLVMRNVNCFGLQLGN